MLKQPSDLNLAIRMYYEKTELSNADIGKLFGVRSSTTIVRLKKMAREEMAKEPEKLPWCSNCVLTEAAYKAWGMDIKNMEERRAKLIRLKMLNTGENEQRRDCS